MPDAVHVKRPAWISELSPRKEAAVGAQIRIRFANDVVPVEMLEAPDRQAALAKIEIEPKIPGRFSFVTPRMITFSADRALPLASRFVVTLHAGLADLKGNTLASDLAYTFTTKALDLTIENTAADRPQGDHPHVSIASNMRLDEASLDAHVRLRASDGSTIALELEHPSPSPSAQATATPETSSSFDEPEDTMYRFVTKDAVRLASTYKVELGAGVQPAFGNLGSAYAYDGVVTTYKPFAFSGVNLDTSSADRHFVNGNPELVFNNGIDTQTLAKAVAISPAPKAGYTAFAALGEAEIGINPAALEPNRTYTVRVAKTLADVFGQTLGNGATATFRTGDLAPSLWAPAGYAIFPATMNVAVDVATANLPKNAYRAQYVKLEPKDVVSTDPNYDDDLSFVLGKDDEKWPSAAAPATANVETTTRIPLAAKFGGPTGLLAFGVASTYRLPGVDPTTRRITGAVMVTNVGVFAQWFPTGGFVRAHHLSDGSPIANAKVDIYESKPASGSVETCATGSTDATGTLVLSKQQFQQCLSLAKQDDTAPALVAVVHDKNDWAFVRTEAYGQSLGDTYAQWSAGLPHSRGTFVSDRRLYQRGETAYFTGFGYFETAGEIVRGSSPSFQVVAKSPQDTSIDLGTHALDAFGSFDVKLAVPAGADLGDWTITATGTHGESFGGSFTVAQFKPPTFKVALSVDAKIAAPGDTVHAVTKSAYLFGAPLARGSEHVNVTRSQSNFTPKGYESFSYGPQYLFPEQPPTLDSNVSESDVTTAADGSSSVAIPVSTDLPFPADYRVDGEVKDVSNLAVSDSATFAALPSKKLIVMRGGFIAKAGDPYAFDYAVVDPDGKPVDGVAVHFTLARRVYDTSTKLVEGSETESDSVHYETAAQLDATSSTNGVAHLSITPDKGGEYRLRANLADAKTDATATDLQVWALGDEADWYRPNDTSLKVTLDKKTYRVGETAHALVASPFDDAELSFAVVRDGMAQRKTLHVHGASANVAFTITPSMLPNALVEAVLVRQGKPIDVTSAKKISLLSRAGFGIVHVAIDSKYVTVTAKPQLPSLGPGATQHVKLHVADAKGRPLQAEVTLAVANDAVLQLSGYRFPDLVTQVWADLPISLRYADNRSDVKLQTQSEPVEKGFGYGGGAMAGPPGTRVRTNFRPVAFFDGSVRTDANGDATVAFTLPDDLTTWRVLVLARTRDTKFGTTDATFVATKPLVTTAILPQFARPGDILDGGVSVTSVSAVKPGADPGNIDVAAQLSGPLTFIDSVNAAPPSVMPSGAPQARSRGTNQAKTTNAKFDGPTAGYRFAMLVDTMRDAASIGAIPDAHVQFRTTLGGANDAFRVPLPIVTDDVMESVVDTGTTDDTTQVPVAVDASLPNDAGGLHVTLASTLLGNTLAPLDAVLAQNPPPFGFEIAGRIAVAADRIMLEKKYGTTADVPKLYARIAALRERLHALDLGDGEYAFYPQGHADLFTTAFIAIQLAQAKQAGVDVDRDLSALKGNLETQLADPTRFDPDCKSDLCIAEARLEALETLAPLGDVRSDHLADIYALREKMSFYERVELARHLIRLSDWHGKGLELRDKLLEQLYETGRFAGLVEQGDFDETPVDGQAQLLGLMIESGVSAERIDRALNSLLAMRGRDGTWRCACDDAEAMNAVVLYANRDTVPPNFVATVGFTGGTQFAQKFEGYKVTQVTKDTAMEQLPRGKSTLRLTKQGAGTLHYTVDFDYAVRGTHAGEYQGIRIDRIVRPAGAVGDPIATFGLAAPSGSLEIAAGNVFDIEDRITTDHPLEGLVVSDSLAAGLEAIDTRFATNSARVFESLADWNIDYQTIERSRVVTFARGVQPGVYAFHYLVRSVTPGTYAWPAARASLALAPDEFGRTSSGTLVIK